MKARWPGFLKLRELAAKRRDQIIILPYLGYGTSEKLSLCGRVLQDEGFRAARSSERGWRNLVEFLKRMESDEMPGARRLPAGPLLLRDFGLRTRKDHKARAIENILTTYPALRFILIGDSGEQDPEIYAAIRRTARPEASRPSSRFSSIRNRIPRWRRRPCPS